jgi:ABC-type transport system involved in multi-copper enzyme maturation permease subunit
MSEVAAHPGLLARLGDRVRLLALAVRIVAGRRYWIAPLLPLVWIAFQIFRLLVRWRPEAYTPADAQNVLIGFPLVVLAVGLGVRIIAGEIDRRTLEIAYTVPGGAHQVWLGKLGGALLLVVAAELLLGVTVWVFCTEFPPLSTLYGALQAAVFFLVLAMALSALFKSEAAGALVTALGLVGAWLVQSGNVRISPFWNPLNLSDSDPSNVLAWTAQNRIGFVLATLALVLLAFGRAENREKLL